MASKNPKTRAASTVAAVSSTPDGALSLSQDQMQALIGLTDVLFKGAEEMRRCQMEAAHQAREHHEQTQARVAKARTPAELIELQTELLRFDLESSSRYWQQLAAICVATQASSMSLLSRSAVAPQAPEATAATVADAPAQAWNQWVDLSKQWTDMVYRTEASIH